MKAYLTVGKFALSATRHRLFNLMQTRLHFIQLGPTLCACVGRGNGGTFIQPLKGGPLWPEKQNSLGLFEKIYVIAAVLCCTRRQNLLRFLLRYVGPVIN